ncbi:MAG: type II toxin-antitoxin system prevent-host-death family antitoxin, partial [Gemmatimonadetes bacterium]|nr:type II toxin-antitoxin system prevent-host-death family antitoxin [Gemmatimonadota bacterium]
MATITVSEARTKMRDVLERVKQGEEIEITQNGEV